MPMKNLVMAVSMHIPCRFLNKAIGTCGHDSTCPTRLYCDGPVGSTKDGLAPEEDLEMYASRLSVRPGISSKGFHEFAKIGRFVWRGDVGSCSTPELENKQGSP